MGNAGSQGRGFLGGWLLGVAVTGGLAYGGHWLWENRRADVMEWKEQGVEWVSSLAAKAKPGGEAAVPTSGAEEAPEKWKAPPSAKGGAWWKKGANWTRTKMEGDEGSLTEAETKLILSWDERKPEMARKIWALQESMAKKTSSPAYAYDRNALAQLQGDVEVLTQCLEIGDPLRLADRLPETARHERAFLSSVRWKADIAHPTAPHVHSGAKENSWEPDDGYVFTSASQNDLTVTYRGHAHRCGRCNGSGSVAEMVRCPQCQGKGRVPNPIVQAGNTITHAANTVNQVLSLFSGEPAPPPGRQMDDPGMRCDVCNGHGSIRQEQTCPDCENGTVWR